MSRFFNEYGVVIDQEIKAAEHKIQIVISQLFDSLLKQGITGVEIRAIDGYLAGTVNCIGSSAILDLRAKLHKDQRHPPVSQENINDNLSHLRECR